MSEPERRNAWREILGMAEAKEEETRRDRSRRRAVFILTVAFIVFLLLGISSGVWLWVADVDYLVAHLLFTEVVCGKFTKPALVSIGSTNVADAHMELMNAITLADLASKIFNS